MIGNAQSVMLAKINLREWKSNLMQRKNTQIFLSLLLLIPLLLSCGEQTAKSVPQDFGLQDHKKRYRSFADHSGQWVAVNFWASWCPPCLRELPDLQRFHKAPNNAVVWGMNEESLDAKRLEKFLQAHDISYPIFPNIAAQTAQTKKILGQYFPIRGLPTTYLVNPDGKIVKKFAGEVSFQQLTQFIATANQ